MKLLYRIADFLLYSNVFIGLCAVALAVSNQLMVEGDFQMNKTYGFVFFATVFTYSLLKFNNKTQTPSLTPHYNWANQNPQLAQNIKLISLLAAGVFFLMLPVSSMVVVALVGVGTMLYAVVNIPGTSPPRKLRDFGLIKTLIVSLVWSVTTVVVPLSYSFVEPDMMVFLLLRRFLFILALTIVFEIKDLAHDRESNLHTLPMQLGVTNTKLLAQAILLFLIVINIVQYFFFDFSLLHMLAINGSLLVSIICIQPINENTGHYMFYLVIDGMMVLQFVFVYLATYFA